ncbi:MAG: hypothetical protein M0R70_05135 [Nitrospirae bacterium]|nr:hypothetical protein [Nitrospirota bacterium]
MSYFEGMKWETIKKDLQIGIGKGMVALKKGAIVAQKKVGELSDEGKLQYKLFTLKTKVHQGFSDLGARVYVLMGARTKNPSLDAKARNIVSRLKKLEAQIKALESGEKTTVAKKTVKR